MATLTSEIDWNWRPTVAKIEIDYEATFLHDSNYGADADGNRGIPITFLDNIRIEDVDFIHTDGRRERAKFCDLTQVEQEEILELVEEQAEQEGPPEPYDPREDPDYYEDQ